MDEKKIKSILRDVASGGTPVAKAAKAIREIVDPDLQYACVDHHRAKRCGFPEVILCEGKTTSQVAGIAREILRTGEVLLATRAEPSVFERLKKVSRRAVYNRPGRCVVIDRRKKKPKPIGLVAAVTAGTADIPVAEEARITAEVMGAHVEAVYDVGVAGIHRILSRIDVLRNARAVVVAAGMEGALASVVGGLVERPVIAVPTCIGYGASFGGLAALLGMLNSCSANVSVVNIDNGFGAGYNAALINRVAMDEED